MADVAISTAAAADRAGGEKENTIFPTENSNKPTPVIAADQSTFSHRLQKTLLICRPEGQHSRAEGARADTEIEGKARGGYSHGALGRQHSAWSTFFALGAYFRLQYTLSWQMLQLPHRAPLLVPLPPQTLMQTLMVLPSPRKGRRPERRPAPGGRMLPAGGAGARSAVRRVK